VTRSRHHTSFSLLDSSRIDCATVGMIDQTFSRQQMLADAISDASARQTNKSAVANHVEESETEESPYTQTGAATALSAAFLREREARFGKATRPATAIDRAKLLTEFHRDCSQADGLQNRCRACHGKSALKYKLSSAGRASNRRCANSERGRRMERLPWQAKQKQRTEGKLNNI